jgi:2-polyprenyl-3-methyl-5-hydroxy-6-metoxy-1,4-benzoquinol methylase
MVQFWNERYAVDEYVYGIEPNVYFKHFIETTNPGKLLLPGEGEGRNAVFAARNGWEVDAIDQSYKGKEKALKLAMKHNANINYFTGNIHDINLFSYSEYDAVGLFFLHLLPEERKAFHKKISSLLKPGGFVILLGFSKHQLKFKTGGPQNIHMLFSLEELLKDFSELKIIEESEEEIELDEGIFHKGRAHVVKLILQRSIPG